MNEKKDESQDNILALASFAVFSELYNSKKDIYDVISNFIKIIISENNLKKFNSREMLNLLNDHYDFYLPEAVIQTVLNKRLKFKKHEQGNYIVDPENLEIDKNINNKKTEIENKLIINNLCRFIEQKNQISLNEKDKKEVIDSFYYFILDNNSKVLKII